MLRKLPVLAATQEPADPRDMFPRPKTAGLPSPAHGHADLRLVWQIP